MSIVLIPLWVLSGALFPVEPTHAILRWIAVANPMRYAVDAMRLAMTGAGWEDMSVAIAVLSAVAALSLAAAAAVARWNRA